MGKWTIDKQFSFCYGHRVWSQQLVGDYCESGDTKCKCRALHGHEGLVHVFLEGEELERGMVTDFKHLGWLKNFLDDNLDHKFIIDQNDPWFNNIINGKITTVDYVSTRGSELYPPNGTKDNEIVQREMLQLNDGRALAFVPAVVPGTMFTAGYNLDVSSLEGPEQEFYEGFFIVNFLPTSEHLSRWVFDVVKAKMDLIEVRVSQIDWYETPKSRSSYRA